MTTVVYHKNCPDGFGAAWAAHKRFGDLANYVGAEHGGPVPYDQLAQDVVFVDFAYDHDTMMNLINLGHTVSVYDHHKTAIPALAGVPLEVCVLDIDRSGAGIAWDYLMKGSRRPALINYVEDRDLWRWQLPMSREISAYIMSFEYDFLLWSTIDRDLTDNLHACAMSGGAILRAQTKRVRMICDQLRFHSTVAFGPDVPVVNATSDWSEIGEELCRRFPSAPYAASYFRRADGMVQYSLRSSSGTDVSEIAKSFGGGGHPGAAGFQLLEELR